MPAAISPTTAEAVRQQLAAMAGRRGALGVQYLVVRRGCAWFEHCFGIADSAVAQTVTPLTTFNAYSITKTLTAAAVLALVEAGRLDLDRPIGVAAGVEGLEAYGSVRDTLLHRAGFRNPNPLRWIHSAEVHGTFDEPAFVAARVAALRGTRRRLASSGYSNVGYLLLGLAIERASGRSFVQAVHELVLNPLEPDTDERLGFAIEPAARHARGHLRRHGLPDLMLGLFIDRSMIVESIHDRWIRLHLHHVNGSPYGGLMANARGLARFGQAVIGSSAGMPPTVRERLLDVVPGPGPARSVGWFEGKLCSHRWFAHAGGGLGYYGELRLYPALHAVSCLLTNGPGLSDARCLDDIDAAWLEAE